MATHSNVLAWRIPGNGGAQWAAIYGVIQNRTRLKRLSSSSSLSSQMMAQKFREAKQCHGIRSSFMEVALSLAAEGSSR